MTVRTARSLAAYSAPYQRTPDATTTPTFTEQTPHKETNSNTRDNIKRYHTRHTGSATHPSTRPGGVGELGKVVEK